MNKEIARDMPYHASIGYVSFVFDKPTIWSILTAQGVVPDNRKSAMHPGAVVGFFVDLAVFFQGLLVTRRSA